MTVAASSPAIVRVSTRNYVIATWQSVMVLIFRVETTLQAVAESQRVFDALAEEHSSGVFLLTIIEANALIPSVIARDAMAEFLRKAAGRMVLSAVVFEGTGFRATVVRSIVAGLAMLTNYPFPHKHFPRVDGAAHWFCTSSPLAHGFTGRELTDVVKELRARDARGAA
jgi:hypothetical protein